MLVGHRWELVLLPPLDAVLSERARKEVDHGPAPRALEV
jgi:hypothetical protein